MNELVKIMGYLLKQNKNYYWLIYTKTWIKQIIKKNNIKSYKTV